MQKAKRIDLTLNTPDFKIAVLSDLHLTTKIPPKQFTQLNEILEKYQTIILNGDYFDGKIIDFHLFQQTKWFELLSQYKHRIYIIRGNHDFYDIESSNRPDTRFFNEISIDYADEIYLSTPSNIYQIEHGHFEHLIESQIFELFIKVIKPLFRLTPQEVSLLALKIQEFIFKIYGYLGSKLFMRTGHRAIKKLTSTKNFYTNHVYIRGHVHYPFESSHYINSGYTIGKLFSYIEITTEKATLIKLTI